MLNLLREFLLAPRANCMGCGSVKGTDEGWLCSSCRAQLAPMYTHSAQAQQICADCGEVYTGGICKGCGKRKVNVRLAYAAYEYEGPIRTMLHAFKFRGVQRMGKWMAGEMHKALEGVQYDRIVPVPLHFTRRFERGYNQSEVLARELSAISGIPWEPALKRVRRTKQQAKLNAEQRRENLNGAFRAVYSLEGQRILLVDDMRTTGTTVTKCAEALEAAGAAAVTVATFACGIIYTKNLRKYQPDRGLKLVKPEKDPF